MKKLIIAALLLLPISGCTSNRQTPHKYDIGDIVTDANGVDVIVLRPMYTVGNKSMYDVSSRSGCRIRVLEDDLTLKRKMKWED